MVHTFLYSLVAIPAEGSDLNQWKCHGRFMPAHDYTHILSKWEYQLRNLHLYQAILCAQNYPDHLIG